jgi:hypothetical protein
VPQLAEDVGRGERVAAAVPVAVGEGGAGLHGEAGEREDAAAADAADDSVVVVESGGGDVGVVDGEQPAAALVVAVGPEAAAGFFSG